jgi:nitrate reductase gamma subunit
MPTWTIIAKGPILRFALAIMVLGLLRLAILTTGEMISAVQRVGDRRLPYRQIARQTLTWLVPFTRLHRERAGYSIASFTFHLGLLAAGLFLRSHLDILQASIGLSWWAVSKPVLDLLTLAAILGGGFLLLHRLYVLSSRRLTRIGDYLLLILILNILVSGYLAGRPWNPISYNGLMLFHTLNGLVLILLVPFTKVSHCVLYPLIRLGTEIAWHFTPQGGSQVVQALHGEQGRKI